MPAPVQKGQPQRSTHRVDGLTALGAVALVILIAKTIPAVAAHRSEIHAAGYHVTTCSVQAERRDDSGIQTLAHVAECVQDDDQIRTEAGDVALTMLSLALVGAGGWRLVHSRHH